MAILRLANISFAYGEGDPVLQGFNLTLDSNQIVALIGPSGCGKTTLVRLLAGLLSPQQGEIVVRDRRVTGPGRDRGVLFQGDTCFKWLTVRRNIAFAVKSDQQSPNVEELLRLANLEEVADEYPKSLSFGMRQRVALMRTLAAGASVMLLDEPLSAVDALTSLRLQLEVKDILLQAGSAAVWVTHDIEEALTVAQRIVVLSGRRPATIAFEYAPGVEVLAIEDRLTTAFTSEYRELLTRSLNAWSN